ncbi:MAG: Gfo/Idh/MocA family oxidoreductase [Clostridiales bacterium]|jgi:predicted dehydrogenase|nr:Gfo/Idh/MocA family oxidoreductase [Clostridiales bacterium]
MSRVKVGIIGTGGRSLLYLNAIQSLPERFELSFMRFRDQEKADRFKQLYNIPVTTSMDELYSSKPDFIVAVNNRPDVGKVVIDAINSGFPVLAETPPAESFEEVDQIWNLTQSTGQKLLVAENYFAEPGYAAKIEAVRRGYIGDAHSVSVSNTHQYHAISVIRLLLNTGFEQVRMIGKEYMWPLTSTQDKNGNPDFSGAAGPTGRSHVIMEFESGKAGFYDFATAQYWSVIRSRYMLVQGSRGEIKDDEIWFMDRLNRPMQSSFVNNMSGGELLYITLGDKILFENPYIGTHVKSIGVATMLVSMKEYLETGKARYSFADGMQDTYLTQVLKKAEQNPYCAVSSETRPWQK